ncbi:response regulator [Myxococcus sp. RHSTA-1-4]|uniref:hybrid sensor histidine kinase/response regulator n=1 Tax=Myxococcus sp. RHSTA-1-4 TaxID=2874601 RepID=UPI001CBFF453|nr:response regulator [Myxococcus sp. RHSTA-1-4]MBZ4419789.1 hybrid sensor histidine kinase/response regulator [Myxococcus sp. RHSTA-1-4]
MKPLRLLMVQTAEEMREALAGSDLDIVLADFSLPRFTALEALKLLQGEGRDIPLIVVSGSIGEEAAVEAMRAGARDYFAKDRLARLGAAVERELREAKARRERARGELGRELLALTSEVLTEPLDLDERLKRLVRIPVPRVADCCFIALHERERGGLRLVALAHTAPALEARAWEMDPRFPLSPETAAGPVRVLATGEPELVVDVAAHELRTPLTTLRLQLGSLLHHAHREGLSPELSSRLERGLRQVRRLATLVEALLDVSRLSSGELHLSRERFDLAEPVDVEVARVGVLGRVRVRDRGIGIPEDQRERIFERFGRAVSSRSYGGLGLGLYLARRSAEAHGGRAWAETPEGGGACFTLELPLDMEARE